MLIFIQVLFMPVLIFQRNFIHLFLQLQEYQDGVLTELRSLLSPQKELSVLHLKMYMANMNIFLLNER